MHTETLIIGGGLSGLSLASKLTKAGRDFRLLEARDRLGGRILTEHVGNAYFDLGPAWFWPGQPRIAKLIANLDLEIFEQYADGTMIFENEQGQVQRGHGYSSMQGSYRLKGGLGALIDALAAQLPRKRLSLSTTISGLKRAEDGIMAIAKTGEIYTADQIALALPPRLANQIEYAPALPSTTHQAMDNIATWMAGQAKTIAVYDTPFWRQEGLSGDAMSRHGPMIEIHDASPQGSDGPFALFGFIGVPPAMRRNQSALETAILAQFGRLFGPDAASPRSLLIKDWAIDPNSATPLDQQPLYAHPTYGLPPAMRDLWDGRLIFSGTETAAQFGGYLEGALEAAANALALCAREKV